MRNRIEPRHRLAVVLRPEALAVAADAQPLHSILGRQPPQGCPASFETGEQCRAAVSRILQSIRGGRQQQRGTQVGRRQRLRCQLAGVGIESGTIEVVPIDFAVMLGRAILLSENHTIRLGVRAFDLLHVAAAVSVGATRFLTFDTAQRDLAEAEGLEVPA